MSEFTEQRYLQLADQTFRRIQEALEPVDPDDAAYEFNGDVLTVSFKNGVKAVINTQRPTRQIWLAARSRAWHFSWDEASGIFYWQPAPAFLGRYRLVFSSGSERISVGVVVRASER